MANNPLPNHRLFIALPVAKKAIQPLLTSAAEYTGHIETITTYLNWHITLIWLGNVPEYKPYIEKLISPFPQSFLPTVTITHIGRGLKENQLWAYIHNTPGFKKVRENIITRLKKDKLPLPPNIDQEFVPHIRLADLSSISRNAPIADHPVNITWPIKEATLYSSTTSITGASYNTLTSIFFTQ